MSCEEMLRFMLMPPTTSVNRAQMGDNSNGDGKRCHHEKSMSAPGATSGAASGHHGHLQRRYAPACVSVRQRQSVQRGT